MLFGFRLPKLSELRSEFELAPDLALSSSFIRNRLFYGACVGVIGSGGFIYSSKAGV